MTVSLVSGFKTAGISPLSLDVSRKYSAAAEGVLNMSGVLTYYAFANNVIGLWLDRGRCASGEIDDAKPGGPDVVVRSGGCDLFRARSRLLYIRHSRINRR